MFYNYLIVTLRNIRRNTIFSFINIIGLGIGLTAFFYIFFWIADEVTYENCFEKRERTYIVLDHEVYSNGEELYFTPNPPALAQELLANIPEIEQVTRYSSAGTPVIRIGENTITDTRIYACDKSFFDIFNFEFLHGSKEQVFINKQTIVITDKYSEKLFGTSNSVGKTLTVNGEYEFVVGNVIKVPKINTHLIINILIPFENLKDFDRCYEGWGSYCLGTYVLLKEGIDPEKVNPKIERFLDSYVEDNIITISLFPLKKMRLHSDNILSSYGKGNIRNVYVFSIIAILIIVIAFINYINLNTTLQLQRIKEIGVRKTLGGTKKHIRYQFLVESILYSFFATDVAIILFELFRNSLNELSGKQLAIHYSDPMYIGLLIITFILISIISAFFPILFQSKYNISYAIKGVINANHSQSRMRKLLIVFQFVVTFILILGSIVLKRQLDYVSNIDLGFDKEGLYSVHLRGIQKTKSDLYREELLKVNGVKSVSACSDMPGDVGSSFVINYWEGNTGDEWYLSSLAYIDEYFIETVGLQIKHGTNFNQFHKDDSLVYVILNEASCNYIKNENPVNQRILRENTWVAGVIKDYHYESLHEKINPFTLFFGSGNFNFLLIKLESPNMDMAFKNLKEKWISLSPDHIDDIQHIDQRLDRLYLTDQKFHSAIMTFTFLAVFIACLGLYGLSKYSCQKRTKEIGVRKALGATVNQLIGLLSSDFLKLVLIAVIVGIPIGYFVTKKMLSTFAYKIGIGVWLYILAIVISLLIAFITIIYQVYKSAKTNPVDNLRYE